MTEVKVADASGNTISMLDFDGFRLPSFGHTAEYMQDVYENLPKYTFRDDDVFLASFPKAGGAVLAALSQTGGNSVTYTELRCTWTFEILTMLLTGQLRGHAYTKVVTMLEAKNASSLDAMPSPRILNSHMPVDKLPSDLLEKQIKTVYVIRNYKDVTVSFYNFMKALAHYNYDGKWEDWLQLHLDGKLVWGDYFTYIRQWEEAIEKSFLPVHVLYYEDLKSDTLREIRRLEKFLGLNHPESFLEEVSQNCQFDVMKKKYSDEKLLDCISFKEGTHFYRKGQVGDWKNWYTVAQSETVDELIRTNMKSYKTSIHFGGKYSL